MKILKKGFFVLLLLLQVITTIGIVNINASDITMIPILRADGNGNVKYRGTSIDVMMPDKYITPETDFRAVWISAMVNDIGSYSSINQYKLQMLQVFETMQYFNLNVMIFHMRMHNDAMYKSNLNPLSHHFNKVNFEEFDPITWVIEECHKRGIEFHAWLNPYRISSSGLGGLSYTEYAKRFPSYNIASNPNNLLASTSGVILNPGEPAVRNFLINTCLEIAENYNVDAIHFDDYFYLSGVDDLVTRNKYNSENLTVANFRRKQVDIFIKDLSDALRDFNQTNNRLVQLGISPTGIYQNGSYNNNAIYDDNGTLISPLGSNTSGYSHYGASLYCDTKKWVDNEWIDYILPQSYWSFELNAASYGDVMDWWVKAVKYKKVNLYSGMGLYMGGEAGSASWNTNPSEAANQVQFSSQYPEIKGHSIYSYQHLYAAHKVKAGVYFNNMENIRTKMWTQKAILPEIRTYNPINPGFVSNLQISKTSAGFRLDFNKLEKAKFYVIYRSDVGLTYEPTQIIDIVGDISINGVVSYIDQINTNGDYLYGIKALSITNTLGNPTAISTSKATNNNALLPLPPLSNLTISDNTFFSHTIDIKWDTVYPLFGSAATYEVYKSENGIDFEKLNTPSSSSGGIQTQKLTLNSSASKVFIKIRTFNEVYESMSDIYEIDVVNRIGTITNFTVIGEKYAGQTVQLKWNLLKLEGVSYQAQYSVNLDKWVTITNASNPVIIKGVNAIQNFTLPSEYSHLYYRIVAINSEGKTISNSIRVESFINLGSLDIRINDQPYTGPIIVNENEIINISWNHIPDANYRTVMSSDLKRWSIATVFNTKNKGIIGNTQQITFGFQHYTVYYQVEAITATGRSYSEIIELRVNVEDIDVMNFVKHFYNAQTNFITSMNIYQ